MIRILMSDITLILGSVFVVSAVSLIGLFGLSMREALLRRVLFVLVALATGAMFGNVLLHLIPEAYAEAGSVQGAGLAMIAGILVFFALEKLLQWRHTHAVAEEGESHLPHVGADKPHDHAVASLGPLVLTADMLHNLLDGFIIAGAYLVSPGVGIATTIAVILHEIPQEIGDFGLLLHAGYSRLQALSWNFFSALTAFLGAGIGLYLSGTIEGAIPYMAAFAGGNLLYIAGSDLIPELRKTTDASRSMAQLVLLIIGVALISLVINLFPH